jgi:hypothetical protein
MADVGTVCARHLVDCPSSHVCLARSHRTIGTKVQ